VQRPHRHLDGEADAHGREGDGAEGAAEAGGAHALQGEHVEGAPGGVRAALEPERQEAEQHDHRADQRVEDELERGVVAPGAAPHRDQEVHRDEDQLPEHEEQDQVQRAEGAVHAGLEHQQQRHEALGVARLRQHPLGVDHAQEGQQQREDQQRQGDPVDAEVVAGAHGGDP
jgi:hypothetical protein